MSRNCISINSQTAQRPWWRDTDIVWLTLLVIAAYFLRAGVLPVRGEESTRAQIAREMVVTNNWLVPHIQGVPFLTRPPVQNWLIALSCLSLGTWNEWAVRFHALVATLLTTLLTYGYARTFLNRLGALTAALAFATMADMFQMGRQAETESLFILLVSASLLVWHWGFTQKWPDFATWAAGYSLMAVAMLTKGLQAPLYFIGATGLYLIWTGQYRRLFSKAHLLGGLVGAVVVAAWLVPFCLVVGVQNWRAPWLGDIAMRPNWEPLAVVQHLISFPFELLPGTLPWSFLLIPFLFREFRQSLGTARENVIFLTICMVVAFPTCWIPTSGRPRFFAPLFPGLACLIGLAVERCTSAESAIWLRGIWQRYLAVTGWIMAFAAVAILVLSLGIINLNVLQPFAGPILLGAAYSAAALLFAVVILRIRHDVQGSHARLAVFAISAFMVVLFTGYFTDVRERRSIDQPMLVQHLRDKLPPNQSLVSLGGQIDALFPYYYGLPIITPRPWPERPSDADDVTYFCFQYRGDVRPTLPFAWEEIASVCLDRYVRPEPERRVVVGRRLPATATSVQGN